MSAPILLIGSPNGQLAWELQRTLGTLGEVVMAHRGSAEHPLDLADPGGIRHLVKQLRPKWIVNAAAYTAVDDAEQDEQTAHAVNGEAPGILASAAKDVAGLLVHYSTDYIFDGKAQRPYLESDPAKPVGVYGRTKLAGEQAVQRSGAAHLIFRTSWVYGGRGRNFLLTMRRLAREREQLRVVADQFGAPTWSRQIAEATGQVLAQLGEKKEDWKARSGVYHMSAAGQCSWFDFAQRIIAKQREQEFVAVRHLDPITTAEYVTPAVRPAWSVLDNARLNATFGVCLPDWQVGLDLVLGELAECRRTMESDVA
jgi:dTDP-4-dehydrorhamnose reductase